jgi:hypothetical protein
VSRGHKVRPVPRGKPAQPVLLVQQVLRALKARKDPSGPRVQLANAVQPVRQVHLEPLDRKARRARLADKVPPDLLASAVRQDRRDLLAPPVPPAVLAQNLIWPKLRARDHQRAASPILRSSTLIAMMRAADLREGNYVVACAG